MSGPPPEPGPEPIFRFAFGPSTPDHVIADARARHRLKHEAWQARKATRDTWEREQAANDARLRELGIRALAKYAGEPSEMGSLKARTLTAAIELHRAEPYISNTAIWHRLGEQEGVPHTTIMRRLAGTEFGPKPK